MCRHDRLTLALLIASTACARTEPRVPLISIQINPPRASMPVGTSIGFTAQGVRANGTTVELPECQWSLDAPEVLSVTGQGSAARLTALKIGSTLLHARAQGLEAMVQVAVTAAVPAGLSVAADHSTAPVTGTVKLTATATFSDQSTRDVTALATWTSSAPSVLAPISAQAPAGTFDALAPGSATVTAKWSGLEATALVAVTGAPLVRLEIQPATATLPLEVPYSFAAVAIFADGAVSEVTDRADWTSSAPSALQITTAASPRGVATALDAGTATLTATFHGLSGRAQVTMTSATLQSIEVSPALLLLAKGTRAPLAATALFSDGSRVDVTAQATWTSSAPAVASVGDSPRGTVTAQATGQARISAAFLGLSGSSAVTVSAARLVAIDVAPASLRLPKGASAAFAATGTYTDQSTQDVTGLVRWSSSDEGIATVDDGAGSRGLATAKAVGVAILSASLEGVTGTAALEVTAAELRGLSIDPSSAVLAKGNSVKLTATAAFSDGTRLDVSDLSAWLSDAPQVASVTTLGAGRGMLTASAPGEATITALYASQTATAQVIVTTAVLRSLDIAPSNPTLAKGTRVPMKVTGTYSDGTTQDVTRQATWTVGDPAILAVSNAQGSNGVITALAEGTTDLRATLTGQVASTRVTVSAALVTSLQVNPAAVTLDYQGHQQLTATASFSDGSLQDVTASTSFTSADGTIAQVTSSGSAPGLVTAGRAGQTSITASYSGKSATVAVTVKAPAAVSIDVRPASVALPAGTQTQLTALAHLADGTLQDVTAKATWSSSSGAASVASGGLVTARALGEATITAALDGLTGTARVTVTAPLTTALTLTPGAATIAIGAKQAFTARAFFSDSTSRDVTAQALFTSSDPATVALNGNVAVGVRQGGPATITASWGGLTATAQVRVVAAALVSVTVTPNPAVLKKGGTAQFSAMANYSDGSAVDVTSQSRWTSTAPAVLTVDLTSGLASARGEGTAQVLATFGGLTGTADVTVQAPVQTRVAIVPPNAVLHLNLIYPYRAYAVYDDGTSAEVTAAATWISTNPQVVEPTNQSGFFGIWTKSLGTESLKVGAGGQQGKTTVQVIDPTLTGVEVSPSQLKLPVGAAAKLSGVFVWSDGWAVEIQNPSWRSLDPGVATIDLNGVVSAQGRGTTSIEMTAYDPDLGLHIARTRVQVTTAGLTGISITVPPTLVAGTATRVQALGNFNDGSRLNLGPSAIWSSSDVSIASIGPDIDSALVRALAKGSVTLGATFAGVTGTAAVTVSDAALASIDLTIAQTTLPLGGTSRVGVVGHYTDGTNLDLTDAASFDSSAPDLAIISNGVFGNAKSFYVVGEAPGQATLRATVSAQTSAVPVTVHGATLSSIALSVNGGAPGSTLTLSGPGPFRLTALGTFSDGTTADVTVFCSFTPGNPGPGVVATISNAVAGEVTVLGRGNETVGVTYAPFFIGQPPVKSSVTLVVP
jgi:hypothetical protein